jgi:hypothetical protein
MKKLSKLEIDLQGNITKEGKPVEAISIGHPSLVVCMAKDGKDFEFDEEYAMKNLGNGLKPDTANAYILGATEINPDKMLTRAIQYYKIQKENLGY